MKDGMLAGLHVRWVGGDDGDGGGDGPLVVLLHGFGAPGDDLVPLAEEIAAPPGTRFLFPVAPMSLGPEYGGGRAWWPLDILRYQLEVMQGRGEALTFEVPEGVEDVRAKVVALLAVIGTEALPAPRDGKVFLGGFSQGSMVALDAALHTDVPLAGVILLSSVPIARHAWRANYASRRGLRVLQSHGDQDPLLPLFLAEALRDELKAAGIDVTWVPFRGGHTIAPNVIDAVGSFLGGARAER
ncbi:alpha/beta hydrolase [Pendulispora albinea]|uniref:Phospholipase n=1 Tax=Pendulispora albinea TaxID=2741071 RepID=A0ABZ2M391_9BACT